MDWSHVSEGKAESGLLLTGVLEGFWAVRCYLYKGQQYLFAALSRPGADSRTAARAKALHAAGHLAYMQSDYNATLPCLRKVFRSIEKLALLVKGVWRMPSSLLAIWKRNWEIKKPHTI
jgi:hypothetical protein